MGHTSRYFAQHRQPFVMSFLGSPQDPLGDIPAYKYRYIFKDDTDGRTHELLCEDWEVGELYRKCEQYRKAGKYKDIEEVHQKVRHKMLKAIPKNKHLYFIVGSHYRFPTYMIIGIVYPRKADLGVREYLQSNIYK